MDAFTLVVVTAVITSPLFLLADYETVATGSLLVFFVKPFLVLLLFYASRQR